MSRRNPYRDLRSTPGRGLDVESAADRLRAFPHRHHAKPGSAPRLRARPAVKADAIVRHGQDTIAVAALEPDSDASGTGVLRDVVQRFLGDPEQRDLALGGKAFHALLALYLHLDAGATGKVVAVPLQRG